MGSRLLSIGKMRDTSANFIVVSASDTRTERLPRRRGNRVDLLIQALDGCLARTDGREDLYPNVIIEPEKCARTRRMIESTTILGRTRKYGDTIVAFRRPVEPLTAMSIPIPDEDLKDIREEVDDLLKIRLANTTGRRSRASYLIQRRYAWRGYSAAPLEDDPSVQVTLSAFDKEHTVATITVGLDSPQGMYVGGALRGRGREDPR